MYFILCKGLDNKFHCTAETSGMQNIENNDCKDAEACYCWSGINQQGIVTIMKFKYFQITEQKTIEEIEHCLESISVREAKLSALAKEFGALECLVFSGGSIAAFKFNCSERPNKDIWKKVKHGFMPKVKTNEHMRLIEIPKPEDWRDVIKKYGFGNEMIIGDQVQNGTAFEMHSSYLKGNVKNEFWAIVVPYQEEFDRKVDNSLVEIKEWEVAKGCDSSET